MATLTKQPGRIAASQVGTVSDWLLPEVDSSGPGAKRVFRLKGQVPPARLTPDRGLTRKLPGAAAPAENPVATPAEPTRDGEMAAEVEPADQWNQQAPIRQPPATASNSVPTSNEPSAPTSIEPSARTSHEPLAAETELSADIGTLPEHGEPDPVPARDQSFAYDEGFRKGEAEGYVRGEANGFEAGMSEGRTQGHEQAKRNFEAEVTNKRQLMDKLLAELQTQPEPLAELRTSLTEMVRQLAEVVVASELSQPSEVTGRLVEAALSELPGERRQVKVRVSPDDRDWLIAHLPREDVVYVADTNLAPGSCRVESEQSTVESLISDRLRACLIRACQQEAGFENLTEAGLTDLTMNLSPADA